MNTNTKNLEILKQFLDGKSYADLANEYGYYNYGSVYQLVVNTLRMLKDYSDYEIPQTGSTEHVREKKDIILKAIDAAVLPKINIVPRVHAYLLEGIRKVSAFGQTFFKAIFQHSATTHSALGLLNKV